ncbi:MAG: hypothetical protein WBA46_08815, partial [Thermomicrobiales bacterium]
AILLADLLTQAQVTVRFAAGPLNDGVADQLLAAMQIDAAAARDQLSKVAAGGTVAFDQHPGLSPEQRTAFQSPDDLRKTLLDHATTRLAAGVETIQTALAGAAVALPDPKPTLPDSERQQHVWVQYADGPRWVDLDPSFAKGEAGKAYATQAETWDAIPDALYHRVRFRCILESNASGVATREDVFVHDTRASDLVGVPVVFAHVDPNAMAKLGVSIGGILRGTTQYVPTLLAGAGGEVGTPITLGGSGGALDVLGSAGSDVSPLAEWLEITVEAPDGRMQQATREVFDRIGIDRRAADTVDLSSLPPIELIDDPTLGKVFLPMEAVWLHAVVGGQIPGAYFDQDYTVPDVQADMALAVHGYHATRDGLQAEIAAAYGYRWYHDRPNITAAILAPAATSDSAIALGAAMDIVHQGYTVVPLSGVQPSAAPQVVAGVLAQVAEQLGIDASAALTPDAPPPAGSVSTVFEAAAKANIPIRALMPATSGATPSAPAAPVPIAPVPPEVDALEVSAVAKARIAEALASGYMVIVPQQAVDVGAGSQVGWWQVDPAAGRTFDLMENGRGFGPLSDETVIIARGPAWRAAEAWANAGAAGLGFIVGVVIGAVLFLIIRYGVVPDGAGQTALSQEWERRHRQVIGAASGIPSEGIRRPA